MPPFGATQQENWLYDAAASAIASAIDTEFPAESSLAPEPDTWTANYSFVNEKLARRYEIATTVPSYEHST